METHRIRNDKVDMPLPPRPAKQALKVILDANALFVPLQFKIDIFQELKSLINRNFEPVLLTTIKREIEELAKEGPSKMRKDASCALKLAESCKVVETDETGLSTDDLIVKIAHETGWPVFTNDAELKKKLRDINVPVIYVRQKSHLEIDGRL